MYEYKNEVIVNIISHVAAFDRYCLLYSSVVSNTKVLILPSPMLVFAEM